MYTGTGTRIVVRERGKHQELSRSEIRLFVVQDRRVLASNSVGKRICEVDVVMDALDPPLPLPMLLPLPASA